MQVHKETVDRVPNSVKGRDNIDIEIYGMENIPEKDLIEHEKQKASAQGKDEYYESDSDNETSPPNPPQPPLPPPSTNSSQQQNHPQPPLPPNNQPPLPPPTSQMPAHHHHPPNMSMNNPYMMQQQQQSPHQHQPQLVNPMLMNAYHHQHPQMLGMLNMGHHHMGGMGHPMMLQQPFLLNPNMMQQQQHQQQAQLTRPGQFMMQPSKIEALMSLPAMPPQNGHIHFPTNQPPPPPPLPSLPAPPSMGLQAASSSPSSAFASQLKLPLAATLPRKVEKLAANAILMHPEEDISLEEYRARFPKYQYSAD
jgi:hypothetical protein